MSIHTVYVDSQYYIGEELTIDDQVEFGHVVKSLRMKTGDLLELTNGKGKRFKCIILQISKRDFTIKVIEEIFKQDLNFEKDLVIAIAMLNKSSKLKLIIEKLTELGVKAIIPYISERTVFPDKSVESLVMSAISALKQCGGDNLPSISNSVSFDDLIKISMKYETKIFANFDGARFSDLSSNTSVLGVIGPEGGFSDSEVSKLEKNGFVKVSLGSRILRAETATIALASKIIID
ncbi:MAG: 16S rRNA (uracil(1498)-N(3))-methyltransferase [Candidatus Delongbacteria bacterium]|nr:16S rRNA (uracil(1498)-N(3))-methyltransferase [Candidatus Delongbacteria bacterium]MBN2834335.1 16S rRNA (uracil(1498)-N(3))-methyltransferase [Candidatus Delongbacteria bacterium]